MLAFFFDIIKSKKRYPSKPDSKKYFRTVRIMQKNIIGHDEVLDMDRLEKTMMKKFTPNSPKILYIELKTPDNLDFFVYADGKTIPFIALNELDANAEFQARLSVEKKKKWNCVKAIIDDILKPMD